MDKNTLFSAWEILQGDALQWAGWIWRDTAVWDKGNCRPQKGRFRQRHYGAGAYQAIGPELSEKYATLARQRKTENSSITSKTRQDSCRV